VQELIKLICCKYGLLFKENLELGCNSDIVCIATNKDNLKVVVKAAKTKNSIAEIKMNIAGYDNLKKSNLNFFIPKILEYEINNDYAFMIMEYLGPNFLYQSKQSKNPMGLYLSLINSLEKVYRTSLKKDSSGEKMIKLFIEKTINIYEEYVYPTVDNERKIFSQLCQIYTSIDMSSIEYCCFSNWDFTPEDVYLTEDGVKYSDPHADIMGVPIIDMACFGGLIKLYESPYGEEAYEKFKRFAIYDVGKILNIPYNQANKIFYLGKLFQCFMSIRFRYKTNTEQAMLLFQEAKKAIEIIV
jgi:hypothetical protein